MAVFDCFTFYNEVDVLEFRLHEHGPFVDKFVLVEGNVTYTGHSKPLFFQENRFPSLEPYYDKIDSYVFDGRELIGVREDIRDNCSFDIEVAQRRYMLECAIKSGATNGDIIMFSDLDEIYFTTALEFLLNQKFPVRGDLWLNTFYANIFDTKGGKIFGPFIDNFSKDLDPENTRTYVKLGELYYNETLWAAKCGWHLSSLCGNTYEGYINKISTFSHADEPRFKELIRNITNLNLFKQHIASLISRGDLYCTYNPMSNFWMKRPHYLYT